LASDIILLVECPQVFFRLFCQLPVHSRD
jgi:hypothetical protein